MLQYCTMRNLVYIPLLLMIFASINIKAQDLSAYIDPRKDFFVFDSGLLTKVEHLPVGNYVVGYNHIGYVDNTGLLKVYYKGKSYELNETKPTVMQATKDFLVFVVNENLKVVHGGKKETLMPLVANYAFSDSIIAFQDRFDAFNVFYNGRLKEVEIKMPFNYKLSDNMIAYVNYNNIFRIYFHGEVLDIENVPPLSYDAGNNILAYIDPYNIFVVFYKGQYHEISTFSPKSYRTGTNMVAYTTRDNEFKVFYDGNTYDLMNQQPRAFQVNEDILYFIDQNGYLHVFYKGKDVILENFTPENIILDNNILAYTDLDGKLKAFIEGEQRAVSQNRVDHRFRIDGRVIRFIENTNQVFFYSNGTVY